LRKEKRPSFFSFPVKGEPLFTGKLFSPGIFPDSQICKDLRPWNFIPESFQVFQQFFPDFAGFETGNLANTGLCIVGGHYTALLFNSVKRGAVV